MAQPGPHPTPRLSPKAASACQAAGTSGLSLNPIRPHTLRSSQTIGLRVSLSPDHVGLSTGQLKIQPLLHPESKRRPRDRPARRKAPSFATDLRHKVPSPSLYSTEKLTRSRPPWTGGVTQGLCPGGRPEAALLPVGVHQRRRSG